MLGVAHHAEAAGALAESDDHRFIIAAGRRRHCLNAFAQSFIDSAVGLSEKGIAVIIGLISSAVVVL